MQHKGMNLNIAQSRRTWTAAGYDFSGLGSSMPLGQILLQGGIVDESQLQDGLTTHRRDGVRIGEALVALGHVHYDQVAHALAYQHGLPIFDSRAFAMGDHLIGHEDGIWCRLHRIIPLAAPRGRLRAAMEDPTDTLLLAELQRRVGRTVQPVVATPHDIEQALHRLHLESDIHLSGTRLRELAPDSSAHNVLTLGQRWAFAAIGSCLLFSMMLNWRVTIVTSTTIITLLHFSASAYKLYLLYLGRHAHDNDTRSPSGTATAPMEYQLPVYTILVPLYKEAGILPQLTRAIRALDWPKAKLDVRLLLEEDDQETIEVARNIGLPAYFTLVIVPVSGPRGKPKACNYGLVHARGEYVVIFDAEDIPEPDQLKKAYAAFRVAGPDLACIQAKLNFYNPNQNVLTRWFTAEYSMWFDLLLPGLQESDAPVPLGGTSNHFRREVLELLGAWDPYNVTEDADLGVRLFRHGYRTAVLDSTTFEEANPRLGNWIRQRSRWIKGYIQTWLVHMRHPVELWRELGPAGFVGFQCFVGGTSLILLLNPIYWALVPLWFATRWPIIEYLFPGPTFYIGGIALLLGNFLFIYLTMAGAMSRRYYGIMIYTLLIPIYWGLMSVAAWKGLLQLFYAPSYWEKTEHGLYIESEQS